MKETTRDLVMRYVMMITEVALNNENNQVRLFLNNILQYVTYRLNMFNIGGTVVCFFYKFTVYHLQNDMFTNYFISKLHCQWSPSAR